MFTLDDPKWEQLNGGYRQPYDPRSALRAVEFGFNMQPAWDELWENLFHQGDVGEASYAAIPFLVRVHADYDRQDWNLYALAAAIDLARDEADNPPVPDWLRQDYDAAWAALLALALKQMPRAKSTEEVRSILSVIAIAKGQRELGSVIQATQGEERVVEFLRDYYGTKG
ncbi:MAG: hypothetical protein H6819_04220 [Phycisphaerales bacterium]|nr:hypothetical protein [Phycisphaerales bacterium]MCB9856405.1 hypothetical protein [Phycisphaerales bacterium]MCB9864536.1 hypothetical protein [Phycisphaerales bacterium]